jgi:predicted amidohydrolase YtcJ
MTKECKMTDLPVQLQKGWTWRVGAILLAWSLTTCGQAVPREEPADLVLCGGKIVTVAASQPQATALAVRGAYIVAVGSDEAMAPFVGPETRIVDLEGRLAVPGFIEGHGHFMSLGNAKTILDLTSAASWEDIVSQVAEAVSAARPGEWIQGRGWHQEKWIGPPTPSVEGAPVHAALTAVSPDNPVLLGHASGHASFANAAALRLAGLSRDSENPLGGELVRDGDGELTGLLRETAQRLVSEALEQDQTRRTAEEITAERELWVEMAGQEALAKGVTSFQDAGASFELIDFYRRLEERDALPIRLYVMVRGQSNDEMETQLPRYRMVAEGNDFLTVRSIKRQIDGALGSHGAWLLRPYEDMPGSLGLVLESEEEIRRTAEIAMRHGFQVNTHAIGDRANRRVLDIYQEVFEANENPTDLRWRVEHAQHLHPQDIGRFARLGVIAAMQGTHCTSDAPWVVKRLGSARAESGAYLWRSLLDSGAVVTNGTDVPVEDIDPIASFYASVTRRLANGERFYPEQRMTRAEALRSYTFSNAFAAFEEDLKGTLEVGKLADIAVLSQDLMTIPEEQIPSTRVDLTIIGGEVRFERLR